MLGAPVKVARALLKLHLEGPRNLTKLCLRSRCLDPFTERQKWRESERRQDLARAGFRWRTSAPLEGHKQAGAWRRTGDLTFVVRRARPLWKWRGPLG